MSLAADRLRCVSRPSQASVYSRQGVQVGPARRPGMVARASCRTHHRWAGPPLRPGMPAPPTTGPTGPYRPAVRRAPQRLAVGAIAAGSGPERCRTPWREARRPGSIAASWRLLPPSSIHPSLRPSPRLSLPACLPACLCAFPPVSQSLLPPPLFVPPRSDNLRRADLRGAAAPDAPPTPCLREGAGAGSSGERASPASRTARGSGRRRTGESPARRRPSEDGWMATGV
jgi:hypothetical protein